MRTRTKPFTLMPLIALGSLSLAVSLPTLATGHLYAATPQRYAVVTVRPGDNLWSLVAARTPDGADVQATLDRVVSENHLAGATLHPGQKLRIPM
ncbi:MAG: LysM peptidoglycan-binding domain-containing protein [Candidatus Eremiobacteraeota bacterium]|nr:LysM peptidoglycan-binding domain-containing protein [Candidatus Eremiobacteraeota bacterium]MBV8355356.1 LysM peptidoglycan-binding domain-containing protein [Candidatus Eremiobacteraeota bacterium]